MHDAASQNAAPCVIYMLSAGARIMKNVAGAAPIDIAISKKQEAAASAMVAHSRWEDILLQPSEVYEWPSHGLVKELPDVMKVSAAAKGVHPKA